MTEQVLEIPGLKEQAEEKIPEAGSFDFEIVFAEAKEIEFDDKDGVHHVSKVVNVMAVVMDSSDYAPVNHTLWLPSETDTPEARVKNLRNLKRFLLAFDVKIKNDAFAPVDLLGKTAHLAVTHGTYKKGDREGEAFAKLKIPRFG